MGILRGDARLLLDEAARRPLTGSVLQLGRMDVYLTEATVRDLAARHGVALRDVEVRLSHNETLRRHGCIDDWSFFRLLGFDQVSSLDVSDYEGVDILHDLNQPVPPELEGRFDLIFEGGTLQHVFDVPQALDNVYRMLKTDGRMVHGNVPSNNHLDFGFYQISPTLFADFYTTNGWAIERLVLLESVGWWVDGMLETGPCRIYDYQAGAFDHLSYGRAGNRQIGVFVVATRAPGATGSQTPQQMHYRKVWHRSDEGSNADQTLEELEAHHAAAAAGFEDPSPSRLPRGLLRLWKRAIEPIRRRWPRFPEPIAIY